MTTPDASLKALVLAILLAAGPTAFAQENDPWYGGRYTGFWGLNDSVGVRGDLPGAFNPPGTNSESLNALRQFGGYRLSSAFAIEGSQTQFSSSSSSCNGGPGTGDNHACYGAAWSLSGVATLPFQSGLSLYGRLGLHYWQKGFPDEGNGHHNVDESGGFSKVYGLGLSYGVTKSITVHAESERYSELPGNNLSGSSTAFGLDSSVHSIGLSIKF